MFAFFLIFVVALHLAASKSRDKNGFVFKEAFQFEQRPDLITKKSRALPNALHTVTFARKQKNIKILKRLLKETSDPSNKLYGQHLKMKDIAKITEHPEATRQILAYLRKNNISSINCTIYDDYITAKAPIWKWEVMLDAQFFEFSTVDFIGDTLPQPTFLRALAYSVPLDLNEHIEAVFNTVQLPHFIDYQRAKANINNVWGSAPRPQAAADHAQVFAYPGYTTIPLINQFYGIANNTGSTQTSQAVFANSNQELSLGDLRLFQEQYGLPRQALANEVGNHVSRSGCTHPDVATCLESNLDVQYIMGVAQGVPTTYHYWAGPDIWLQWITQVANLEQPAHVYSISYGSYEATMSRAYLDIFNAQAIKLGLAGVTIIAATGDDGVAGFAVRMFGSILCDYAPMFPASSPYVLAVGGTMVRTAIRAFPS
jgi:tripeptidyl-peptidase I